MEPLVRYVYDGTYTGFLTAVFESFERRHFQVQLRKKDSYIPSFFETDTEIVSDRTKAGRVQKGLAGIVEKDHLPSFYRVVLSEDEVSIDAAFYILQRLFRAERTLLENYGNEQVIRFHQTLTKVRRESHRMKAFIRFRKSSNGLFYCLIEPDFNVLPLIIDFFRKRYAEQPWLIYDVKRDYGVLYNLVTVEEVSLLPEEADALSPGGDTPVEIDEQEQHYQILWKQYFKSTNIEARRNMKLHLRHVPKRYWKYLPEKTA